MNITTILKKYYNFGETFNQTDDLNGIKNMIDIFKFKKDDELKKLSYELLSFDHKWPKYRDENNINLDKYKNSTRFSIELFWEGIDELLQIQNGMHLIINIFVNIFIYGGFKRSITKSLNKIKQYNFKLCEKDPRDIIGIYVKYHTNGDKQNCGLIKDTIRYYLTKRKYDNEQELCKIFAKIKQKYEVETYNDIINHDDTTKCEKLFAVWRYCHWQYPKVGESNIRSNKSKESDISIRKEPKKIELMDLSEYKTIIQLYEFNNELEKKGDVYNIQLLRKSFLNKYPKYSNYTQNKIKQYKKEYNLPGPEATITSEKYSNENKIVMFLLQTYYSIGNAKKIKDILENKKIIESIKYNTIDEYLSQIKLFNNEIPLLTKIESNIKVKEIYHKFRNIHGSNYELYDALIDYIDFPQIIAGYPQTKIFDQYKIILVPEDGFVHINYNNSHNKKFNFEDKGLFGDFIIEKYSNTIGAFVCMFAKFKEKFERTLCRNREKDKEYQKKYEQRPERKEQKKENRINNKERIYFNQKHWFRSLPDEKKREIMNKNAEWQRQYRETPYYLEVYLNLCKLSPNRRFSKTKSVCKTNNTKFNLTKDKYKKLMYASCHFCGDNPNPHNYKMSWVVRNNTSLGFTPQNVLSTCETCGSMKGSSTINEFNKIIFFISNNLGIINYPKINTSENKNLFKHHYDPNSITYKKYCYSAKDRNIEMLLNEEQFDKLTNNQKCYYSGLYVKKIGIDRFNSIDENGNKLPYHINNCVPCLPICNYVKGSLNYDEFKIHCKKICSYKSICDKQKKINN